MEYKKTKHAQEVLERRKISDLWIQRVLDDPGLVEPDAEDPELEHRLGKVEEFGQRVLRVIINITEKPNKIVTAYFDRTMKGNL